MKRVWLSCNLSPAKFLSTRFLRFLHQRRHNLEQVPNDPAPGMGWTDCCEGDVCVDGFPLDAAISSCPS